MTEQGPDQQGDIPGAMPPPPPPQPISTPPLVNPAPASGVGQPADLATRFLARLIDSIIVSIVTSVIVVPLLVAAAFSSVSGFGFFSGFSVGNLVAAIVTVAITIGYYALMESNTGQTVGKMLIGLRTEGPDGNKPTMEQALKRNAWYALYIIPILGWLAQIAAAIYIAVTINNSPTRTGWHDTFAGGTRVIKTK